MSHVTTGLRATQHRSAPAAAQYYCTDQPGDTFQPASVASSRYGCRDKLGTLFLLFTEDCVQTRRAVKATF